MSSQFFVSENTQAKYWELNKSYIIHKLAADLQLNSQRKLGHPVHTLLVSDFKICNCKKLQIIHMNPSTARPFGHKESVNFEDTLYT